MVNNVELNKNWKFIRSNFDGVEYTYEGDDAPIKSEKEDEKFTHRYALEILNTTKNDADNILIAFMMNPSDAGTVNIDKDKNKKMISDATVNHILDNAVYHFNKVIILNNEAIIGSDPEKIDHYGKECVPEENKQTCHNMNGEMIEVYINKFKGKENVYLLVGTGEVKGRKNVEYNEIMNSLNALGATMFAIGRDKPNQLMEDEYGRHPAPHGVGLNFDNVFKIYWQNDKLNGINNEANCELSKNFKELRDLKED